jgi:hypothetical protein
MKTFFTSLTTLCILLVFSLDSLAEGPQISKGSIFLGTTTDLMGSADDAIHLGGANTAGLSFGSTWYKNGRL